MKRVHIILLILKIIGIVLGAILGLLLTLLLMVLFVPIRYHINAEKQQDFQCQIRLSWFLKGIEWFGEYAGEHFIYRLKILGITIKSNLSEKTKKKHNKESKKKDEKTASKEKKQKDESVQSKNKKTELAKDKYKKETDKVETEKIEKNNTKENSEYAKSEEKESEEKNFDEEFTFFEKIDMFLSEKYKNWTEKIKRINKKIKNMLISIRNGISKIKLIWGFLTEEENKAGFKVCLETFKKIVKHIKPKVLKGYLEFGTDDPCKTGQILGVIAMFYGSYGKFFEIKPDFEKAILKYSVSAKGRLRIFTVGKIVLQAWFSKELKKLIKNYEHCKEELENGR